MAAEKKMITLKSSDGEAFEVDEAVAMESQTIKHLVEDCADNAIPLPNVTSHILAKIIEYCRKHVEGLKDGDSTDLGKSGDETLKKFDEDFVNEIKADQNVLFDLILAANYLNIKSLLDLTCQTVADMISPLRRKKRFAGRTSGHSSKQKGLLQNVDSMIGMSI